MTCLSGSRAGSSSANSPTRPYTPSKRSTHTGRTARHNDMEIALTEPLPAERKELSVAARFRDQIELRSTEFAAALPPHIPADRFKRVILTAVTSNPELLAADRRSLIDAAMKAAQDGLLPDGRDGALVVYRTRNRQTDAFEAKVQWMPMIGGILKKVRNSGQLLSIAAYVAYENDTFTYVLGDDEKIEHVPAEGERGKPRLVYAIAKTKDGGTYREVMTVRDVEKVRAVSRAGGNGPWKDWWDEMARKTVLRRLSKRLPMSSDLDDLLRRDAALYDFARDRREFRAVRNPLSDRPPAPQIEHDPDADRATDDPIDGGHLPATLPPAANDDQVPAEDPGRVELDDATEQGDVAFRKGRARTALPSGIKDNADLTAAWRRGWDKAKAASDAEGGA